MPKRFITIFLLCLFINPLLLSAQNRPRPTVGAIRWDAWTGGHITVQVERTLSPKKYHHRLPWFARIMDDNTARIDGSPQAVMDRDIHFAAKAGLDYWAFLVYAKDDVMSKGLKQYLSSHHRHKIRFCLILHNTLNAAADQWPKERDHIIALLKEAGYQTVLNQRPLLYIFSPEAVPHERVKEIKRLANRKGINPYIAYMGWQPDLDLKKIRGHRPPVYAAVSSYAYGSNQPHYKQLTKAVETNYWENAVWNKVPYIPLVTTGWDKRPRQDNLVSWEKGQAYHTQKVFPSIAQPDEIATHLKNAIQFTHAHTDLCKAQSILIYAWNEYDEGGWISPTLGTNGQPDTSRLDAIEKILKP